MPDLKQAIRDVPDFPRAGILFRDIAPLLRDHFEATVDALDALLSAQEWREVDAPCRTIEDHSLIVSPVAGALSMPQTLWPVAE